MKKRKRYRNGDDIGLPGGCGDCQPSMINGVLCHETGCPSAWKDKPKACDVCGCDFYAKEKFDRICRDCDREMN